MSDGTKIEWTDATWNVINGCSVTSPGCTNCYAMRLAGTRLRRHPSRAGLTQETKAGPVWTGETRFNEAVLDQPLRWRRPRRIFVCAHGDLFHESVPFEWIDRVFAVMALAGHHTFQVLTKRADRMREYMTKFRRHEDIAAWAVSLWGGKNPDDVYMDVFEAIEAGPLPNVWLGVSAEDQKRADERIPDLLDTPAAKRWISAEPLLGPIDFTRISAPGCTWLNALSGYMHAGSSVFQEYPFGIDWVVAGGESGPGARPMHPDWARSLRDQCAAAGVAFHFKQHGSWAAFDAADLLARADAGQSQPERSIVFANPDDRSGMMQDVWRVGKKAAGRHLDGQLHDGYPA